MGIDFHALDAHIAQGQKDAVRDSQRELGGHVGPENPIGKLLSVLPLGALRIRADVIEDPTMTTVRLHHVSDGKHLAIDRGFDHHAIRDANDLYALVCRQVEAAVQELVHSVLFGKGP